MGARRQTAQRAAGLIAEVSFGGVRASKQKCKLGLQQSYIGSGCLA